MNAKDDARDVLKEVKDRLGEAYRADARYDADGQRMIPDRFVWRLAVEIADWLNATAKAAARPEPAPIEISFCPRTLLAETGRADARPRAVIVTTPGGKITLTCTAPFSEAAPEPELVPFNFNFPIH